MKRGGQVIYAGPLGLNSNLLVEYFQVLEGYTPVKSTLKVMHCEADL